MVGTINLSSTLRFSGNNALDVTGGFLRLYQSNGVKIVRNSNATALVTVVDGTGKFGIGTTSPAVALDVNGYIRGTNFAALTTDFTDANAAGLQIITGLSFTLPASVALNAPFECNLMYSQATKFPIPLASGSPPTRRPALTPRA